MQIYLLWRVTGDCEVFWFDQDVRRCGEIDVLDILDTYIVLYGVRICSTEVSNLQGQKLYGLHNVSVDYDVLAHATFFFNTRNNVWSAFAVDPKGSWYDASISNVLLLPDMHACVEQANLSTCLKSRDVRYRQRMTWLAAKTARKASQADIRPFFN